MSMKINWINKRESRIADNNDSIFISVYKQLPNGKAERVRFRFSEAVHANFFESTDRILVGTSGNRIYFKPVKKPDGYRIGVPKGSPRARAFWFTSKPLADFIHEHPTICEANLQYDDKQNLFYIEAA